MKKRFLPRRVVLLGRNFKVVEKKGMKNKEGEALEGEYDHGNREIQVDPEINDEDKFYAFAHECAHSYLTQLGVDQRLPEWAVECCCQIMAMFAADIIKSFDKK
jgi:hypothetical protein